MTNRIRRAIPSALALLSALMLSACGSVRYPEHYVLHVDPPAAAPSTSRPGALGPIAVSAFGCPDYLCDGRIVYRPTPQQVAFYEFHRWAVNPGEAVTQLVEDRLRAGSLFAGVARADNGVEAGYLLRGNIERFEEVDQDRNVLAVCTISAEVFDAKTRSVIWRATSSETVPVQQRTVAGVVTSLGVAAQVAIDRLMSSMERELKTLNGQ